PMLVVSVAAAGLCGYLGLAASYEASLNHGVRLGSGSTVVVALTFAFVLTATLATLVRRWRRAPTAPGPTIAASA
ncbi:MAG TPA: hypothetical protein VGP53_02940, partial [Acidimicrobiales bacterium]|nr:hypothetical protein [Acidimicrobiales bacterium]